MNVSEITYFVSSAATDCIYSPQNTHNISHAFENNNRRRLPDRREYLSMLAAFTTKWYRDVKPCLVQFSSGLKQFSTRTLRLIRETGDGFVLNSQYWTAVHTFAALVKTQEAFYQRSADVWTGVKPARQWWRQSTVVSYIRSLTQWNRWNRWNNQ